MVFVAKRPEKSKAQQRFNKWFLTILTDDCFLYVPLQTRPLLACGPIPIASSLPSFLESLTSFCIEDAASVEDVESFQTNNNQVATLTAFEEIDNSSSLNIPSFPKRCGNSTRRRFNMALHGFETPVGRRWLHALGELEKNHYLQSFQSRDTCRRATLLVKICQNEKYQWSGKSNP